MNIAKACPDCARALTVRVNKDTGVEFLGCSQRPDCTHTEPMPMDIIMGWPSWGRPLVPCEGPVDERVIKRVTYNLIQHQHSWERRNGDE